MDFCIDTLTTSLSVMDGALGSLLETFKFQVPTHVVRRDDFAKS